MMENVGVCVPHLGRVEQLAEVLVLRVLVVALLTPSRDGLTVEDDHLPHHTNTASYRRAIARR